MSGKRQDPVSRFWRLVAINSEAECWPWQGYVQPNGYGSFHLDNKRVRAHRMAFELSNGFAPVFNTPGDSLCVMHTCDNRRCCNPAHLKLGTWAENNQDRDRKGRHVKASGTRSGRYTKPERTARGDRNGSRTHREKRPRGVRQHSAKLTDAAVLEMRRAFFAGERSAAALARSFGVSKQSALSAIHKKTWTHI